MKKYLLVHYGEIGLKGKNRDYFVKRLGKQIKERFSLAFARKISMIHTLGRFLVEDVKEDDKYHEILKKIAGIKNFYFVYEGSCEIEKLAEDIWAVWKKSWKKKFPDAKTFCVRVRKAQNLPYKSFEAERNIGAILLGKGIGLKAKMKDPDVEIYMEVFSNHGYFSFKKNFAMGGMSANTAGKFIVMLSAGIDSPVAAYKMIKRGARMIFVHFDGYPYTDDAEREHVKELVEILAEFQYNTKLFMVPFGKLQKAIATNMDIPSKYRTILYRRFMVRIAERICKREGAYGIVTGDNLGQVASQTAPNMFAVHAVINVPVYAPLIAYDKEEIVEMAREIGTFEISKLPCKDTCSMFTPKSPELNAKVYDLMKVEESLDVDKMVDECVKGVEVIKY